MFLLIFIIIILHCFENIITWINSRFSSLYFKWKNEKARNKWILWFSNKYVLLIITMKNISRTDFWDKYIGMLLMLIKWMIKSKRLILCDHEVFFIKYWRSSKKCLSTSNSNSSYCIIVIIENILIGNSIFCWYSKQNCNFLNLINIILTNLRSKNNINIV